MSLSPPRTLDVFHPAEVALARRAVRELAVVIGFDARGCEEAALVAGELAANLVRHAGGGCLMLAPLAVAGRRGLQIESVDQGPGIANIDEALTDGFSTAGSLGNGLGAVNRLMDEFEISSRLGRGTRILCRKWVRSDQPGRWPCPLDIGVATRPKPGYDQNGDDYVITQGAGSTLVGVIDGLGHGEPAHLAAVAARQFVLSHSDQPLDLIFRGAGFACRGTRGCVMALARFDGERGKMTFASVGNIEARVIGSPVPCPFVVYRGVIGLNAPAPRVTEQDWNPESILVLFSDGLTTHWCGSDFFDQSDQPAERIAQDMLRRLAKPNDDATLLIVKKSAQ